MTVYDRVTVALRACVRMDTIVSSTSGWKLPDNEADEYERCAFVYAPHQTRCQTSAPAIDLELYARGSHARRKEAMQKLCSWIGSYIGIEEAG